MEMFVSVVGSTLRLCVGFDPTLLLGSQCSYCDLIQCKTMPIIRTAEDEGCQTMLAFDTHSDLSFN